MHVEGLRRKCDHCHRYARPGKVQCKKCAKKTTVRARLFAAKRIAQGLCSRCGVRPRTSKYYCKVCIQKKLLLQTKTRQARRLAGLCSVHGCGNPRVSKWYCEKHLAANRAAGIKCEQKHREEGLCRCGREISVWQKVQGYKTCGKCITWRCAHE